MLKVSDLVRVELSLSQDVCPLADTSACQVTNLTLCEPVQELRSDAAGQICTSRGG